jgi:hypothetical protein
MVVSCSTLRSPRRAKLLLVKSRAGSFCHTIRPRRVAVAQVIAAGHRGLGFSEGGRSSINRPHSYSRATNTRFPASVIHIRVTSTAPSSSSRYSFRAPTRPRRGVRSIPQQGCSPTRGTLRCSHLDERQSSSSARRRGLGERLCRVLFLLRAKPSRTPASRLRGAAVVEAIR